MVLIFYSIWDEKFIYRQKKTYKIWRKPGWTEGASMIYRLQIVFSFKVQAHGIAQSNCEALNSLTRIYARHLESNCKCFDNI